MKKHVLLVDDDKALTEGLRRRLAHENYRIVTTTSIAVAAELVNGLDIGVVVVDQFMPGGNGTELINYLAQAHPNVPCIMLTGQPSLTLTTELLNEYKVFRFFSKPCNLIDLAVAIRQALALHEEGEVIPKDIALINHKDPSPCYTMNEPQETFEDLCNAALKAIELQSRTSPQVPKKEDL